MHAAQPNRTRPAGDLAGRIATVRHTIEQSCDRSGRDAADVRVVAVTKGRGAHVVKAVIDAGLREIGENRVGEAEEKLPGIDAAFAPGVRRHMIGHLQRNKVRRALELFDWIQSVDSLRLAGAISKRNAGDELQVLVQVNAGGEEQKHGFAPEAVVDRALEIAELDGLRVRGMMTMAPWTDDEAVLRGTFATARRAFERLVEQWRGEPVPDTLSMGMSNDYAVAIEEGATMVRIGTALLGPIEPE